MGGISNSKIGKKEKKKKKKKKKRKNSSFVGGFLYHYSDIWLTKEQNILFLTASNDKSYEPVTHWGSVLDIKPQNALFLFNSFDFVSLKSFLVQMDRKIVNEILNGIQK